MAEPKLDLAPLPESKNVPVGEPEIKEIKVQAPLEIVREGGNVSIMVPPAASGLSTGF